MDKFTPNVCLAIAAVTLLGMPMSAAAIDTSAVMQCVEEKQQQRWEGVNRYAVVKSIMSHRVVTHYERINVRDKKGRVHTLFRQVTPDDYQSITIGGETVALEDFYDQYATSLEMTSNATASEMEQGMEEAGLPPGMLAASGSDPAATFDPRVMFGGGATMMREMAEYKRQQAANPEDRAANIDQMTEFVTKARVVGEEKVAGRRAYHLRADDINQVQQTEDGTFEMQTAHIWVDKDWCVPVKTKMEGTATTGGQSRPFVIETTSSDYRQVPNSNMFEPYKQTVSMGGVMDAAQQAELKKAQAELAKMEEQFAGMSADQRKMVEQLAGPQLKTLRTMAETGTYQSEIIIDEIVVNADPTLAAGPAGGLFSIPAAASAGNENVPTLNRTPAPAATTDTDAALERAQQACLQQKIAEAQEAQKKKRGFGRLLGAVGRTAARLGGADVARDVYAASRDVYDVNATRDDLAVVADELGISQDAVEACRNP